MLQSMCCKELDTSEQLNNNQGSKSRPREEEKVSSGKNSQIITGGCSKSPSPGVFNPIPNEKYSNSRVWM